MSETTEKTTDHPHQAEVRTYQTSQGPRYSAVVSFNGGQPWHGPMRSTWKTAKDDESVMIARGGGLDGACLGCRGWAFVIDKSGIDEHLRKCPACGGTGSGFVPAVRAIPQAAPVPMPKLPGPTDNLLVDAFDRGRSEGQADVAARLRRVLDPDDVQKLNLDALIARAETLLAIRDALVDALGTWSGTTGEGEIEDVRSVAALATELQCTLGEVEGALRREAERASGMTKLLDEARKEATSAIEYADHLGKKLLAADRRIEHLDSRLSARVTEICQAEDTKRAEAWRFEEELDAIAQALGCGRAGILEAIEGLKTARETLASEAGEASAYAGRAEEELDAVCSILGCGQFEASETVRAREAALRQRGAHIENLAAALASAQRMIKSLTSAASSLLGAVELAALSNHERITGDGVLW